MARTAADYIRTELEPTAVGGAGAADVCEAVVPGEQEAVKQKAEEQVRELGGRLGGLSLPRQVAVLAIWPFLQQVLAFLVNFVDTAIAGRLSVEATNAIAIAAYFGWFLFLMTSAVGSGGAALIAREGRLVGIGSLIVGEAVEDEARPGNMFVPIDALRPIYADLLEKGRGLATSRPWLRSWCRCTPPSCATRPPRSR